MGYIGVKSAAILAAFSAALLPSSATAQSEETIEHTLPPPSFFGRMAPFEIGQAGNQGMSVEQGWGANDVLADHRALSASLTSLQPQRPGIVDAYVLSVALDSDPVFAREAREAGRVLSRRYGADGRTLVLAGPDGRGSAQLGRGTPNGLAIALARLAEVMDAEEDVLILFITSHGTPNALYYHYGDQGFGLISPSRLLSLLTVLELDNRLAIINACYSGIFVSGLASDTSVVVSAASAGLTSFGCAPGNDWTYFGDAFINRALRQPQPINTAFANAKNEVSQWERADGLTPSNPQISIGANAGIWLVTLESRVPTNATTPVGRSPRDEGR